MNTAEDDTWECRCCGWYSEQATEVYVDTSRSYVRRLRSCPWDFSTLRALGTCIWCYSRGGFVAKATDCRKRVTEIQDARRERRRTAVHSDPAPRYDEVWAEGVEWLDSLARSE